MNAKHLADSNFLIPNSTFWVELIIFAIVLVVLGWYVAPAVSKALRERQEMVDRTAEEGQKASERLTAAEQRYQQALAEARTESAGIRDAARAEGQRDLDDLRSRTQAEVASIQQRGAEELSAQRAQAMTELRPHVGELSMALAGRIVGDDVVDDQHQTAIVTRFLVELERSSDG